MYFQRKLCYNATSTYNTNSNNNNCNKNSGYQSPLLAQVQSLVPVTIPIPNSIPPPHNNGTDKQDNSISGQKSWFELLYIFHMNTRL